MHEKKQNKTEVFKEKDNLGFGLSTEVPFNILPGIKSLWVPQPVRVPLCPNLSLFSPGLPGRAWPPPSVSCVGLSSLCQQHLECVHEIQRGQVKFSKVPWCQKPSNQVFPICLAFYLQSITSAPWCFTSKIRVWIASQKPQCCSEQDQRGSVLVNAWDLSEMLLDALVKSDTWGECAFWRASSLVCILQYVSSGRGLTGSIFTMLGIHTKVWTL